MVFMNWNGFDSSLASQFGCHPVKSPETNGFIRHGHLECLILQSAETPILQSAMGGGECRNVSDFPRWLTKICREFD
jgi:hypothetical protein